MNDKSKILNGRDHGAANFDNIEGRINGDLISIDLHVSTVDSTVTERDFLQGTEVFTDLFFGIEAAAFGKRGILAFLNGFFLG